MNIIYFYYSGTGNTAYTVDKVKKEFEKYQNVVTTYDVTDLTKVDYSSYNVNDYDLILFSYPIYGFRAPRNFETFVKGLTANGKPYVIIKNSREALTENDSSSLWIVKTMKKKDCKLLTEYHLLMPYNIHFRHDDRLVKKMLLAIEEKVPKLVKEIIDGNYSEKRFKMMPTLVGGTVGFAMQRGAKLIGKSMQANDGCVSCGICAKNCPQHNIEMVEKDGRVLPNFNNKKCMLCMRCVMNCPKDAIRIKRYLRGWEVNGKYDFNGILANDDIEADYEFIKTNGKIKKSYKKYFNMQ